MKNITESSFNFYQKRPTILFFAEFVGEQPHNRWRQVRVSARPDEHQHSDARRFR